MRKLLIISSIFIALAIVVQSCAPRRGLPRPQGHPTPPKKVTMVEQDVLDTAEGMVYYS